MPMNVLEIAVYAMVLTASQPHPYECVAVKPEGVNCTNGLSAKPDGPNLLFNTGVQVMKDRQGRVQLSNGLQTRFDSSAWVEFQDAGKKPVVSVRKTGPLRFKFSNGFQCEAMGNPEDMARCYKP
ncbi:hypothetical protein TSH100_21870 [Azospirillum sp. TSH100]|uniref:hypothetical protein n=1 Tax=Azospirillum sp. TSH100 TaxID=652764 RepID=UPI000D60CB74|nr:hypothetical protein [Azospirillum sp. TSH100]PWC83046.1 hypothetical protein TSH100_21870 [Azospirillum sp. TSH100]QCG89892.1 hypothetical protein E6C72_19060 [Azospirillum sp. TSH100]